MPLAWTGAAKDGSTAVVAIAPRPATKVRRVSCMFIRSFSMTSVNLSVTQWPGWLQARPLRMKERRLLVRRRRWRSRRGRCRLARNCIRLHQLDSGSVGIVNIYLAFLVDSGSDGKLLAIGREGGASLKNLDGFRDIGNLKRD